MTEIGALFAEAATNAPLIVAMCAAAIAGLVSFASPCVVPLVPGYMSYLAGLVGAESPVSSHGGDTHETYSGRSRQWAVVGSALLFICGFTVVFVLATVSVFGAISVLTLNAEMLMRIGGVITIVMGIVFMGGIGFMQRDTRIAPRRWTNWLGAPMLGGVFALGWTPCLGPTLAAIISVSAGTEGMTAARGTLLIIGYCLGLGLPFVLVAIGSARAMRGIDFLRHNSRTIQVAGGITMVLVGLALVTGVWGSFISIIRQWTVEYGTTLI
ncbi:MAG: cytochrome c biogenesis CcdA family protein [Corynebacterium sp.]|nr:cytochrome c biogenesis CcdA family protein [Corynebacterium sp.]